MEDIAKVRLLVVTQNGAATPMGAFDLQNHLLAGQESVRDELSRS